jgi:hypothetical protein
MVTKPFPDRILGEPMPFEPFWADGTLVERSELSTLADGYDALDVAGERVPLDDVGLLARPDGPSARLNPDIGLAGAEVTPDGEESWELDEDELAGTVLVVQQLPRSEMEALAGRLPCPAEDRAGEETLGDQGPESAGSGKEPPAGQDEARIPLQAAPEPIAVDEEVPPPAGAPMSFHERLAEPAVPEIVSCQPDDAAFAPGGPVGAAEPGSGEQGDAGVTAEAETVDDPEPKLEEAVLARADDVLAVLESTEAPTGPDPGRQVTPSLPEEVSAAVRKILGPATDSSHEREPSPPIDGAELEALVTAVLTALREAGRGPIGEAVRAATSDPAIFRALRRIADDPGLSNESIRNVTQNARLSGAAASTAEGKLIIAALILLLAAGIAVPLLAGAATEVILTNEIAIAALAVSVAALRKE